MKTTRALLKAAPESEVLLDALVEAQKKTQNMDDGDAIAQVFMQAFESVQAE